MEKKTQTLAELKGEGVVLRDKIEADKGTLQDVLDLNKKNRLIGSIESWLLWGILSLILMLSGCQAGVGLGLDGSLYYPNVPGKLEDPAASRRQSTQHTTGMARNNLPMIGGGK